MTDKPNRFPTGEDFVAYASGIHVYTGRVLLIQGEGVDQELIGRFEDETGRLHELDFLVAALEPGQEELLHEGAQFKLTLTPEDSGCGVDSIDGIPIARHEAHLDLLETETITQAEIDAALARARERRATGEAPTDG